MWSTAITTVLFVIIFATLFHRYYVTTDLKHPKKIDVVVLVATALTYILVVKVLLSYILTATP